MSSHIPLTYFFKPTSNCHPRPQIEREFRELVAKESQKGALDPERFGSLAADIVIKERTAAMNAASKSRVEYIPIHIKAKLPK